MNQPSYPLVSVGMPVFNAAKNLKSAVQSILGQTYLNIELIISDNSSTDSTVQIASELMQSDKRVRLLTSASNVGIFSNFNKVLQESCGEFFLWSACDDFHSSNFIEECVGILMNNPSAVLCQTKVAVCLEKVDDVIYNVSLNSFNSRSTIESRFKETLYNFPAVGIYGVYRSDAIKSIDEIRKIPGGDIFWIQRLSLIGEFMQSEKILFRYIARPRWNSFDEDLTNLNLELKYHRFWIYRTAVVFMDQVQSIRQTRVSFSRKLHLIAIASKFLCRNLFVRGVLKVMQFYGTNSTVNNLKRQWYWRFMHNSNIQIVNAEYFQHRVINPSVGIQ